LLLILNKPPVLILAATLAITLILSGVNSYKFDLQVAVYGTHASFSFTVSNCAENMYPMINSHTLIETEIECLSRAIGFSILATIIP
jgi:hypothetical protein